MAKKTAIIVAHRSHAQALADGEVVLASYPHLEDDRLNLGMISAVHNAVSTGTDPELAKIPYQGPPEAEGGDGGSVWRLPDDLVMVLVSMDVAQKQLAMTRLQAAPEFATYDPSPARIGTLLDDLSRLAQEAMKQSREMWVRT